MVVDRPARAIHHAYFNELGQFLTGGDLLVFNSSRTLPAALPARRSDGTAVELRLCVRREDSWDVLSVEPVPPHRNLPLRPREVLDLGGGERAHVAARRADIPFLWRIEVGDGALEALLRFGRPIRYSYVPASVPLHHYQTVYASHPGSAEMPSAGRAFSWELLLGLQRAGVTTAELVLHTGLSSFQDDAYDAEHHLFEEWFSLSATTADAVNAAGRTIAVGTTVVRALETAATATGRTEATRGWTNLQIPPGFRPRAVDALLTGFHEPHASHFDLLRAFVDAPLLERAYAEAIEREYLWHEFGDVMLIV
jgi:S-adenosylmethionine:tRNA ribosyltransferase-isomerase